jgi:hypothetical protein
MARFTSKSRAADPGNGKASKLVPLRNLYKIVDAMVFDDGMYPFKQFQQRNDDDASNAIIKVLD